MQEIAVESQPLTQLTYGLVEVQDLSVCFTDKSQNINTVVDKINFTVEPGSFVCLLGPSGCGKSTVLNTIAGFIKPTKGKILVDEQAVTKPGADRGFVFQQYSLLPWKTVFQNVEFGLRIKGIAKAKRQELVAEYLNRVGLYNRRDSFPHQLSGGMKQRASIVRALINSPSVLLMDEPFSALDAQTRHMMQELLMEIWQDFKTTVIFVTHDIEEAVLLGDRILVMGVNPGHIKEDIAIDLKRPRHIDDTLTPEFIQISRQVLATIREETLKSMEC
ncbi:ABC transporter ATP-binding protein [Waterburya agarophytonicola K14]|uniref:ABC transporter ATP-binding protein n=1 Tax=Waterburya agarophytonicola KI4 TaxID=2874699 RepID=A0A964BXK3_9CYAN|nr:ABC transporter ATP-binding protein [Waterburya agarophytonicola]MCC0179135.1 ABC transporter ATP-binding protein [Waterburya agarophytonicola KI4]